MRFFVAQGLFIVDHFGVDTCLWLVFDPLANKEFVFVVEQVGALTFALVFDPMAFEVVTVTFRQNAVAVAFALMPLAFINVLVGIDHASFTLGQSIDPVAVIAVAILVEERSSAVHLVFKPVAGVLSAQFAALVAPVSALAVALVHCPHAFVLVTFFVMLNAEALFAIVFPVADVPRGCLPQLAFDAAVFLSLFLFYPVNAAMSALFLSFGVVAVQCETGNWTYIFQNC